MRNIFLVAIVLTLILAGVLHQLTLPKSHPALSHAIKQLSKKQMPFNPMQISYMRTQQYPGSIITLEQTVEKQSSYTSYVTSYLSEGLKIYALLTLPTGEKPKNGWPVIVFNHGYIPADVYKTTERYGAYVDAFAKNGYIVFKPDYRGNGNSQGQPEGAYYSPAYTIDDLNAIASIKKYHDANPKKIGVWGHSLGGNITLRDMVIWPDDIQVAVIWGGVVASYTDMLSWHDPFYQPSTAERAIRNRKREEFVKKYGSPRANPDFWNSIDPMAYLSDIKAPLQLHVGELDEEVPATFSANLAKKLVPLGKTVEFYSYPGSDHNISQSFSLAMQRSLDFFDKYLKK